MDFRHDPDRDRYVVAVDGREGELNYRRLDEGTLDFRRTFVPPELRGRGIGAKLVLHALDHAREEGRKIVPTCPFVGRMLDEHPEYRDLVADR